MHYHRNSSIANLGPRATIHMAASKGGYMTIPFEKLKARLLANPKVKAAYDALAPEFEIAAELPTHPQKELAPQRA
jgi:hypothetical protein